MTCEYNIVKKDGTKGITFPLLSSLFGNLKAFDLYNFAQSKASYLTGKVKARGYTFTEKGLVTSTTLTQKQKVELIKSKDPKALFTYDTTEPVYKEVTTGKTVKRYYSVPKLEMDTDLPIGSLQAIYNERLGYKTEKLVKSNGRELITVEALKALLTQPITPTVQGNIAVVFNGELSIENLRWIEIDSFIPEVAEISGRLNIPIRYNKNLNKGLKETDPSKITDIQEAQQWIRNIMPNANIELVEDLIDGIGKGSYNTVTDLITLSEKYANKQTAKHEVGHVAWNRLSKKKQEKLLNEGSKLFGIPRGTSSTTVKYSQAQQNDINYTLKSVDLLRSDKAIQLFKTLEKNKVKGDTFWKKVQELGIPKEQINLLKEYNTTNREELITSILSDYSFTVEVNRGFQADISEESVLFSESDMFSYEGALYMTVLNKLNEDEYLKANKEISKNEYFTAFENSKKVAASNFSNYYSNLTVPGGTNYIESEIATALITPAIKGHAKFATDNGIGWFRSDDYLQNASINTETKDDYELDEEGQQYTTKKDFLVTDQSTGQRTKTRRILELQSDLFQKGRDKDDLAYLGIDSVLKDGFEQDIKEELSYLEQINKAIEDINNGNYESFINGYSYYIKTNIGKYKNIYAGNTYNNVPIDPNEAIRELTKYTVLHNNRLKDAQLKIEEIKPKLKPGELQNQFLQLLNKDANWVTFFVKSIIQDSAKKGYEKVLFPLGNTAGKIEGHTDVKPIYSFYENTITNILNKQFGKENVIQIIDEFGNTWNEIDLSSSKVKEQTSNIKFQASNLVYTGDLAIEEKIMEMMENTSDEDLPKTALGKWIQSVRNFFRNLFKEKTVIEQFLRDVNQGRLTNKPLKLKKGNSKKLQNGDYFTTTTERRDDLAVEYMKELDKYEGKQVGVPTTVSRDTTNNPEDTNAGDILNVTREVDSSKIESNLQDPKYKKFVTNVVKFISPLLSNNAISSEFTEEILSQIALKGVNIVRQDTIIRNGEYSPGYYDSATDTIYIDSNLPSEVQMQVLIHEGVHSLTVQKIPDYNEDLHKKYRELQQLHLVYEYIQSTGKYDFPNIREFVAQVFTNYELQQDLRKIGTQDISKDYGNRPLLGVVLQSVYSFFRRLFMLDKKDSSEVLSQTLYNINHIMKHYSPVHNMGDTGIYDFEFSQKEGETLTSFFDVVFEHSDSVPQTTFDRIDALEASYEQVGDRFILNISDEGTLIKIDEQAGKITFYDVIEEVVETFTIGNDGELQTALETVKTKANELLGTRRKDIGVRVAAALNVSKPVSGATDEERKLWNKTKKSVGQAFIANGDSIIRRIQQTADRKNRTNFETWTSFVQTNPEYSIDSLDDPNIVIHKEEREGQNYYSLILTSVDNPASSTKRPMGFNFLDENGGTWSEDDSRKKGITIQKNSKGRAQLTAALLMMKIRQQDPTAVVGQIKYFSVANKETTGNGSLQELDLSEPLANLEAMAKSEEFFKELPSDIQELIKNKKLLDPIQYNQSYIQLLLDFYQKDDVEHGAKLFSDITFVPETPTRDRKVLLEKIEERMSELQRIFMGRKNSRGLYYLQDLNDPVGQEFLLLAQSKAELTMNSFGYDSRQANKGMYMDMVESHVKNRKEYFNPYLIEAGKKIDRILASFKENFIVYSKNKNKYTEKFIKAHIEAKGQSLRNIAFNYTEKFYENLYEKQEVRTIDKHGRISNEKVSVNTMKLKNPNDSSLQPYEREYIIAVMGDMRSNVRRLVTNHYKNGSMQKDKNESIEEAVDKWETSKMKITLDHHGNVLEWGGYKLVPGLKGGLITALAKGNLVQGIKAEFDFLHDEYLDAYDNGSLDDKATLGIISSFTLEGEPATSFGRNSRLKNIGLITKDGELLLMDGALNNNISIDLQASADFYVAKVLKQEKYAELQKEYLTGKILLLNQSVQEGAKMSQEFKVFEDQTRALVDNTVKELKLGGIDRDLSKFISAGTKIVGKTVLSGSLGSMFNAISGAITSTAVTALSRKFGKRFPGPSDMAKAAAFVLNPMNFDMVEDIMFIQQLHNSDEGKLIFNQNIKAGSNTYLGKLKGAATGRNIMTPIGSGDYFVKSVSLIAQLMYDDILQNYKYDKNGDIYYDLNAEKANPSKNPYRQAEFQNYLEELEKDGRFIREDGNPLVAYSYTMANNLKSISASILGAFTQEEMDMIALHPIAKIPMQFKKFLIPKMNLLYSRGYTNTNIMWYEFNSLGEVEKKHLYTEGLLQTLWGLHELVSLTEGLNKEAWADLMNNDAKRANLRFAIFAGVLHIIAYMFYSMIDDEWKKKNPYHIYLTAVMTDITGYMNPNEYIKALTTPVSIVYAKRVTTLLYKAITWDLEEAGEQAIRMTGISRTISNFKEIADYVPEVYRQ